MRTYNVTQGPMLM